MLIIKEIEVDDYSGYNEIKDYIVKPKMLQKGVLRTNCIDRLDRTNVAQYVMRYFASVRLSASSKKNIDPQGLS
jgi:hypothetical protein